VKKNVHDASGFFTVYILLHFCFNKCRGTCVEINYFCLFVVFAPSPPFDNIRSYADWRL